MHASQRFFRLLQQPLHTRGGFGGKYNGILHSFHLRLLSAVHRHIGSGCEESRLKHKARTTNKVIKGNNKFSRAYLAGVRHSSAGPSEPFHRQLLSSSSSSLRRLLWTAP